MPMVRLVLAWLLAGGFFWGWELAARQLRRRSGARDFVDLPPGILAVEALWLVLLTGLWFASLGRGGWWLALPLLALSALWTPTIGRQTKLPVGKRFVALGVGAARVVGAGLLAGAVL